MIDKLCILQGSCSELHCSVALVCDTKMVIAMFGLACVHAAASMYARDIDKLAMATAGPGIRNSENCAAFACCARCTATARGLSCSVCCAAWLSYNYVATCWQMLTMMCT